MSENALENLKKRGFVQQCSNEQELGKVLAESKIVFYTGFDASADSLHAGHLVEIMAMAHLQKAGHIPIVLVGGGTTLIGDPSGKTEMRKMLSPEEVEKNIEKILGQFKKYLSFKKGEGLLLNNAQWLTDLKYIDFLRDIGKYFKVNEMIKHEGYRLRMERETGLSFIEFNYQLLQAYDFLFLFKNQNCELELGGDDQWGNILAGVNLVRQITGNQVFGLTFPLITTAEGKKMGKTEAGAIWLDENKTSPYEMYQYWINTDDRDAIKFLKLFTFLPLEEINEMENLKGADLTKAKEKLAFEATKIVHGKNEAEKARDSSISVFSKENKDFSSLPTVTLNKNEISSGMPILNFLAKTGIVSSRSEALRLIKQGGIYINDKKIESADFQITENLFSDNFLIARKGKKQYHRIIIE